jgi:hypothetical protein
MAAVFLLTPLSLLALTIMIVWSCNGYKDRKNKMLIAAIFILTMIASWVVLVLYGGFHPVGEVALGMVLFISIFAFFIPKIFNREKVCNSRKQNY